MKDRLVFLSEACGEDDFAGDFAAKTLKPLAGMQRSKTVVQSSRKRDQTIAVRDDILSFFISTMISVGAKRQNEPAAGDTAVDIQHQTAGSRIFDIKIGADRMRQFDFDLTDMIARKLARRRFRKFAGVDHVFYGSNFAALLGHADAHAKRLAGAKRLVMEPEDPGAQPLHRLRWLIQRGNQVAPLDEHLLIKREAYGLSGNGGPRQLPIRRRRPRLN